MAPGDPRVARPLESLKGLYRGNRPPASSRFRLHCYKGPGRLPSGRSARLRRQPGPWHAVEAPAPSGWQQRHRREHGCRRALDRRQGHGFAAPRVASNSRRGRLQRSSRTLDRPRLHWPLGLWSSTPAPIGLRIRCRLECGSRVDCSVVLPNSTTMNCTFFAKSGFRTTAMRRSESIFRPCASPSATIST